ncbi:MAG TPA: hydrolase [Candidatus Tectomicrobia bacterium]|nr:hydrolase [Candidatus Tectomicrobia bacterium]
MLVPSGDATLPADVTVPRRARGLVLFAHGSGSGRHSPRNRHVARALEARGFGTVLIDLLTPDEQAADATSGRLRFDIELLGGRLRGALDWLVEEIGTAGLPVGLFGASTGAAAALTVAAARPSHVQAVVSRGGRPDLAGDRLGRVRAATLLIVGGADPVVLALNRDALGALGGPRRLEIVPRAGHLFEEPGALDEVARLAADWFSEHLAIAARRAS